MAVTFGITQGRLGPPVPAGSLAAASAELPDGAYTTLRTYHGDRLVRLANHLARLRASARDAGARALSEEEVRQGIAAALRATRHPESRLRLTFAPPRLFVTVEPFEPLPEALYVRGVWCVTAPLVRANPQAKDTRFLPTAHEAYEALPAGAHEGLLVGQDDAILEGLSSNFFAVLEGALRTEDARALPGVTRSVVLDVARGLLPVELSPVTVAELPRVSECFITSASRGVLPVAAVDEVDIGSAHPGQVTAEVGRRFEERIAAEAERV